MLWRCFDGVVRVNEGVVSRGGRGCSVCMANGMFLTALIYCSSLHM